MSDKSNDCPVCLKDIKTEHTVKDLCVCIQKLILSQPSNYVSPDSAKTEMFEKLNKDFRLKIQEALKKIDEFENSGTYVALEKPRIWIKEIKEILEE